MGAGSLVASVAVRDWPAAWPSGKIEGVLCRGAIEIKSLQWDERQIEVTLSSVKSQTVVLELPSEISQLSITGGAAKASPADRANRRTVALPSGQSVAMVIKDYDCGRSIQRSNQG